MFSFEKCSRLGLIAALLFTFFRPARGNSIAPLLTDFPSPECYSSLTNREPIVFAGVSKEFSLSTLCGITISPKSFDIRVTIK